MIFPSLIGRVRLVQRLSTYGKKRYQSQAALMSSSARPQAAEPSNKRLSVDAERGVTYVDLSFIEEPLGLSREQGYGFPRFESGDTIGPERRYKIIRKLGWGMNASIWMAFDEREKRYVSVKALKGYATELVQCGVMWELVALQRLSSPWTGPPSDHCLRLFDHFTHPGKAQDGNHLCLVTQLLAGDVRTLQVSMKNNAFPLPLAKRILLHILRGIEYMHRCGVTHTDLKHDNILFDLGRLTTDDVNAIVEADPPRLNPPEESWDSTVQSAVSQPLPLPASLEDAMMRMYVIADFGSAQSSTAHNIDDITAAVLRAPETILRGPWNDKVDIWTFGCLAFEFVTGAGLFEYQPYEQQGLDAPGGLLWQMMCFTGERFTPEQLQASTNASRYFDPTTCWLRSRPPHLTNPFTQSLTNYKTLQENEVASAAALMKRCLRLNPENRPSAQELLEDPFWEGVV